MNYFISKPFSVDELVTVLNEISCSLMLKDILNINLIDIQLAYNNMRSDIVFFTEIIKKFKINSSNLLERIEQSIIMKNGNELRINAHTLKGIIAIFDARKAFELSRALEEIGRSDNLDYSNVFIPELIKEVGHLTNKLDIFVSENS